MKLEEFKTEVKEREQAIHALQADLRAKTQEYNELVAKCLGLDGGNVTPMAIFNIVDSYSRMKDEVCNQSK